MIEQQAIEVINVSKKYQLYKKPVDRLKETLNPFRKSYHKDFYALQNVSFSIGEGETVGIIGKNGSGKSTLLKIITGVLNPTSGSLNVNGKISALLELGAGFNPEYTGMENIFLLGTIMGFQKEEIENRLESIITFADIGQFMDQPVKSYSSGMFVRLAFAVAINVDPDILIVDEALSVGDVRFQQKCLRKIEEFRLIGKTVIFVSHDLATVVKFCDRLLWINEGVLVEQGAPLEIVKKYQAFMSDSQLTKYSKGHVSKVRAISSSDDVAPIDSSLDVHGDKKAMITGISLFDYQSQNKLNVVVPGQMIKLAIKVRFNSKVADPIVGFSMKDRLGNIVTQTNSYVLEGRQEETEEGDERVYNFSFICPNLTSGYYSFSPAVASGTQADHVQHCWVHDALIIEIVNQQLNQLPGFIFLEEVNFAYTG